MKIKVVENRLRVEFGAGIDQRIRPRGKVKLSVDDSIAQRLGSESVDREKSAAIGFAKADGEIAFEATRRARGPIGGEGLGPWLPAVGCQQRIGRRLGRTKGLEVDVLGMHWHQRGEVALGSDYFNLRLSRAIVRQPI